MAETVIVRPGQGGKTLLYSSRTGHLLQKLPPPSKFISHKVTISSSSAPKRLTDSVKKRLIQEIEESDMELAIVLPELRILPDASLIARSLIRNSPHKSLRSGSGSPKKTVSFSPGHEYEDGSEYDLSVITPAGHQTDPDSDETETSVWASDFDPHADSDVSSLATCSWTPSEEADRLKQKKDQKKRPKSQQKGTRILPDRVTKTAANKRIKKRKGRVYDF